MALGLPPLALSTGPAVATATGTINAPFSVGSGSAGGIPTWLVLAGAAIGLVLWLRKR
jgi:hypothetical protein